MHTLLDRNENRSLGRLCASPKDTIWAAPAVPGIERIEARFTGEAFARHRHDTYALGVTLRGIQTFWYRGGQRISLPGQVIILHPDEVHDGAAGTDAGLIYRMLYIDPALIGLAGRDSAALPFVADPVVTDTVLRSALLEGLADMKELPDNLAMDHLVADLADGLARHAKFPTSGRQRTATQAVRRVKEFLDASIGKQISSNDLKVVSGLDRYTLTRQFKSAFATSPHRYFIMRRLVYGRRLLTESHSLADVALRTGFADQSHFHRQFLKAFGITPGKWRRLVRGDEPETS